MKVCKSRDELAKAIKDDEICIEVEGPFVKFILELKYLGAWKIRVAFAAISIAAVQYLASSIAGSTGVGILLIILAMISSTIVLIVSFAILGFYATLWFTWFAIAGGVSGLYKILKYEIEKISDNKAILRLRK